MLLTFESRHRFLDILIQDNDTQASANGGEREKHVPGGSVEGWATAVGRRDNDKMSTRPVRSLYTRSDSP